VVGQGRVLEPGVDADTAGVCTFLEVLADDPRLDGTVLQTVGAKGWDGIAVAVRV
jgi:predicted O-methyltransferase YrrM